MISIRLTRAAAATHAAMRASAAEAVALARRARATATPHRVALTLSNSHVKASVVDDLRDLVVATASTKEARVQRALAARWHADAARVASLDAPATLALDARTAGVSAPELLPDAEGRRGVHTADRHAVGLVATLLAERAQEAGVRDVRSGVRGRRGNARWFEAVLTSRGLRIATPKQTQTSVLDKS